jgi:hypothetical protein
MAVNRELAELLSEYALDRVAGRKFERPRNIVRFAGSRFHRNLAGWPETAFDPASLRSLLRRRPAAFSLLLYFARHLLAQQQVALATCSLAHS